MKTGPWKKFRMSKGAFGEYKSSLAQTRKQDIKTQRLLLDVGLFLVCWVFCCFVVFIDSDIPVGYKLTISFFIAPIWWGIIRVFLKGIRV